MPTRTIQPVKGILALRGVKVSELARHTGLSYYRLSRSLNDISPTPWDVALKVSCYLGLPISELFNNLEEGGK